jgi:hypothetical protein
VEMQNYEPITIQHAINRHIERMNNPSFWRDEYRQVPEHQH